MGGFFRIGDKLINRTKMDRIIARIFELMISSLTQKEVDQVLEEAGVQ